MNPYKQYMYSYPHKTAYRPLSGVRLKDYAQELAGAGHGMYLHVPFCQARCGYCNLFSVTGQGQEGIERYLDAVERQSSQYEQVFHAVGTQFEELVIGGGTPLFLSHQQLERVFAVIQRHFSFADDKKIVVETAPNQTDAEKLALLVQAGVTRVSMGIQSFCDRELAVLGRFHSAKKAREALTLLKSAGFSCINVDFIYGIPGQTVESLLESLKEALSFVPDEIFLYPLYIKHGVRMELAGIVPDAEAAQQQYQAARQLLVESGYRQDSMRRFVLGSGKREYSECGFGTSIALGCGGRSYLGNLHFSSPYAVEKHACLAYLEEYEQTKDYTDITYGILLSQEEQKRRYVIRHLLIRPGLLLGRYQQHFGSAAMDDFPILADWAEKGYVKEYVNTKEYLDIGGYLSINGSGSGETQPHKYKKDRFLMLTEKGMALSDYLGPQLISPKVYRAMEEWEEIYGQAHGFIPRQSKEL